MNRLQKIDDEIQAAEREFRPIRKPIDRMQIRWHVISLFDAAAKLAYLEKTGASEDTLKESFEQLTAELRQVERTLQPCSQENGERR